MRLIEVEITEYRGSKDGVTTRSCQLEHSTFRADNEDRILSSVLKPQATMTCPRHRSAEWECRGSGTKQAASYET